MRNKFGIYSNAGSCVGLGVLGGTVNSSDAFIFRVSNDMRAILLGLQRKTGI